MNEAADGAPTKSAVPPVDIKELTIRNLDTGEEYIIGEKDPDFDFDTFELRDGLLKYIKHCVCCYRLIFLFLIYARYRARRSCK